MRQLALLLIIASVCVGGVIQPLRDPQALHFANQVRTMTDGDTTPDVSSRFILVTANTTATTITDFDRGAIGQVIFVIIGDANTTFDFTDTNLHGNGGYDYAASENDFWVFTHDGAFWYGSFLSLDLANSVLGTTNRVTVTDNLDGTVTLTSPQDTHTSASMALANIYLADNGKAGNTDNYWQFHDDVDFVTLSASSNLGLGTDTPDSQLTIQEGINPLTADADADSILIRGVGALGITLATGTDGSGNIFFDDGEDGNGRGRVIYDHSDDSLALYTNSSEAINIDSDGNILITDGDELRFNDVGNSHYVGFEAPALTASQIWVLPDADGGSGEVLATDGSGALSWSGVQSEVDLNTTHRDSNGVDHGYIDQSVVSGAAPAFTSDNFSDGGSNAIITTTQETNFETAYDHSQDNTQAHTDYLINNGDDSTSGSLTATDFYVGDGGKMGSASAFWTANESSNFLTTSSGTNVGLETEIVPYLLTVNTPTVTNKAADVAITAKNANTTPLIIFQDDAQAANPFRIITNSNQIRFEIDPDGKVLINSGTNVLTNVLQLHVKNSADDIITGMTMERSRGGGGGGADMGIANLVQLENSASALHDAGRYIVGWADPSSGSEDAYFSIETMEAGSFVEGLRVVGGNVGINATNPGEKLEVDGNILASGDVAGTTLSVTSEYTLPTTDGSENDIIKTDGAGTTTFTSRKDLGLVYPHPATYAGSPTGTSGSAGNAQTVITRTIPANALTQVGDRIRIRTWVYITGGASITITTKLNGIIIADITHTGAGEFDLTEAWCHYVDDTHFNNIEQEGGAGLGALTDVNVPGSNWDASQDITIEQTSAVGSYVTVYGIFVDILPKGI